MGCWCRSRFNSSSC